MTADKEATAKAVKALVKALGVPEGKISRIEVNCSGVVKMFTRDRAYFTAAHIEPFQRGEQK